MPFRFEKGFFHTWVIVVALICLTIVATAGLFAASPTIKRSLRTCPAHVGDVNADGKVNSTDAAIILRYLAGSPVPSKALVENRGDVNGDGRITAIDANLILQYDSRIIRALPVCDNGLRVL